MDWAIPRRQGSFGSIHRESGRIPSQWVGAINRYGWAESIGMGGRLPSEWVGGINRNHRAESIGITGRIGSEYAVVRRQANQVNNQAQEFYPNTGYAIRCTTP